MPDKHRTSRRRLLSALGAGLTTSLAGCPGEQESDPSPTQSNTSTGTSTRTDTPTDTPAETEKTSTDEPWEIDPVEHDKLIGAVYKINFRGENGYVNLDHPWHDYITLDPVLGQYRSRDPDVVNQHVKWAREHGINWFNVKAGHPAGFEERTVRDHVLEAELADEMQWSVLDDISNQFRVDGRIDVGRSDVRDHVADSLQHWSDHYFDRDNYLHIDGRPVLYYYNVDTWTGDIPGAIDAAVATIPEDPYLIGDIYISWSPAVPMATPTPEDLAPAFDAIYDYHVHPVLPRENFLDHVNAQYEEWRIAAEDHDLDFIPMVIPGFNDDTRTTVEDPGLPESHPGLADRQNLPRSRDRFRQMCRDALRYVDPDIDAVMVNTFNEWQESTTVEPGESYGTDYLEIIEDELARGQPDYLPVDDYVPVELRFNRTKDMDGDEDQPIDHQFAVQAASLTVDGNSTSHIYDIGNPLEEPAFTAGVYPATNTDGAPRESRRMLGGPTERTTLHLDPDHAGAESLTLTARPIADDVTAQVHYDGEAVGELAFDDGMGDYAISID